MSNRSDKVAKRTKNHEQHASKKRSGSARQHPSQGDRKTVRDWMEMSDTGSPRVTEVKYLVNQVQHLVDQYGLAAFSNEIVGAPATSRRRAPVVVLLLFVVALVFDVQYLLPGTDQAAAPAPVVVGDPLPAPTGPVAGGLPLHPAGTRDLDLVTGTVSRGSGQTGMAMGSTRTSGGAIDVNILSVSSDLPGQNLLITTGDPAYGTHAFGQHEIPASGSVTTSTGLSFTWISSDRTGPGEYESSREVNFTFARPGLASITTSGKFPTAHGESVVFPLTPAELDEVELKMVALSLNKVS